MQRYQDRNRGFRYTLTCIDVYSRLIWARPLKKAANDVTNATENICQTVGVYPHILQRDNGGEFAGELSDWMNQHVIKSVRTLSYSPNQMG